MILHLHRVAVSLVPVVAIWGVLASPALAQNAPATADAAHQRPAPVGGDTAAPGVPQEQRFDPKGATPAPDLAIGADGKTLAHARGHIPPVAGDDALPKVGSLEPVVTKGGGIAAPATPVADAKPDTTAHPSRAPPPGTTVATPSKESLPRGAPSVSSTPLQLAARSASHSNPSGPAPRAIKLDLVGQLIAQDQIASVRWEVSADGGKTWSVARATAAPRESLVYTLAEPGDYLLRAQASTKDGRAISGAPIAIRATKGSV